MRRLEVVPNLVRETRRHRPSLDVRLVDDGKSTLIGRMLWDASDLYEDQRENVRRSGRKAAGTDLPDFSMLLDGLVAEREQGITIDIAWKYFDTDTRRFVIIDSPGHEQYTRNMASGASHADVAIVLVDARSGVKKQTKRHAAILDLVGVKHVVLAVNKMDLVGWSRRRIPQDRGRLPHALLEIQLLGRDRHPSLGCFRRQRLDGVEEHDLVHWIDAHPAS